VVSITVFSADGAIVAGASSASKGALYQPKGGNYYLQINRAGEPTSKWHVSVVQMGPGLAAGAGDVWANDAPPTSTGTGASNAASVSAPAAPSALVLRDATTKAALTVSAPSLTSDQARAIVLIKGDIGEGTGFLVKTADGPAVVTNNHVIRANTNLKILTTTGEQIKTLGLKGASDRDLVMIKIQDDHYTYLELATDIAGTVQTGDAVITPGNSEGGEVMLNTKGTVLGIGPQLIEISNPFYHGNSGGPLVHAKSGKVLGAVIGGLEVHHSDDLDKASSENKDSAITTSIRYFGIRLDNVPEWDTFDWNRFLNETTFLKNFRDQSLALDSFLNGARYEKAHVASATGENGHPDSHYYLRNEKISTAQNNFHKFATDADNSQRLDAWRELIMSLQGVARQDMDAIQDPTNFYPFDQLLAAHEVKYRKALASEIEKMGDKMSDLGH